MSDKQFKTWIFWGSSKEPGDQPTEYAFDTQAELNAFFEGVNAAEGWLDWEEVDGPNYVVDEEGEVVRGTPAQAQWRAEANQLLDDKYGIVLDDCTPDGYPTDHWYADPPEKFVEWIAEKNCLREIG